MPVGTPITPSPLCRVSRVARWGALVCRGLLFTTLLVLAAISSHRCLRCDGAGSRGRALRSRFGLGRSGRGGEEGVTLIELLITSVMSIVLLGGIGTVLIGALREEPKISQGAANVQTVRFVLERMTRELRQGFKVYGSPSASQVSFETYERHATCGAKTMLSNSAESIPCEVTYSCAGESCTRLEAPPGVNTGTPERILTGISNASGVFTYSPNKESPTYVGITLALANNGGGGTLTISDGAALSGLVLTD